MTSSFTFKNIYHNFFMYLPFFKKIDNDSIIFQVDKQDNIYLYNYKTKIKNYLTKQNNNKLNYYLLFGGDVLYLVLFIFFCIINMQNYYSNYVLNICIVGLFFIQVFLVIKKNTDIFQSFIFLFFIILITNIVFLNIKTFFIQISFLIPMTFLLYAVLPTIFKKIFFIKQNKMEIYNFKDKSGVLLYVFKDDFIDSREIIKKQKDLKGDSE